MKVVICLTLAVFSIGLMLNEVDATLPQTCICLPPRLPVPYYKYGSPYFVPMGDPVASLQKKVCAMVGGGSGGVPHSPLFRKFYAGIHHPEGPTWWEHGHHHQHPHYQHPKTCCCSTH